MNPTDEQILEEINENGRSTPKLLAELLDKHPQYIRDRIEILVAKNELVNVGYGLYDTPAQAANYDSQTPAGDEE